MPLRAFLSYARPDAGHCADLMQHLDGLQRDGTLEIWSDGEILPGNDWQGEILRRLQDADIVLLLVSPPYLASDFCRLESELAMERLWAGKARVVPILVRHVDWTSAAFKDLQFLLGTEPVPELGADRDAALTEASRKLREIAAEILRTRRQEELRPADRVRRRRHRRSPTGEGVPPQLLSAMERLNDQALRLAGLGESRLALDLLDQALAVGSRYAGEGSDEFAILPGNHGLALQDIGDLVGARADLEHAVEILERRYSRHHPKVAVCLVSLGAVLVELGEARRACNLLEQAEEILASAPEPDGAALARARTVLAGALGLLGDIVKAEDLLAKVLASEFAEPNTTARAYSALGRIAFQEGRLRAARAQFKHALKVGEKAWGEAHPFVAIDLHNLGLVLRELGRPGEAADVLRRAVEVLTEKLGADSPRIAWTQAELEVMQARSA